MSALATHKFEVLIKMVATGKVEIGYRCDYEKMAKFWFALKIGELIGLGYEMEGASQPKQAEAAAVAVARLGVGAQLPRVGMLQ